MKRLLPKVCLLLALATLVLVPATVYASPPTAANGEIWFDSRTVLDIHQTDGNTTIITDLLGGHVNGTITGDATFTRRLIIHNNGEFVVDGIITGVFTIEGRSGTFTQRIDGKGVMSTGDVHGQWVIKGGTGDLAGQHAQGTYEGTAGVRSTYSGQIHFDPN